MAYLVGGKLLTGQSETNPPVLVEQQRRLAAGETSADYLKRVRSRSNYDALRVLINLFTAVALFIPVGLIVLVFFASTAEILSSVTRVNGAPNPLGLLLVVGVSILLALIIFAARQSALLLVDIADVLADAHRRKPGES